MQLRTRRTLPSVWKLCCLTELGALLCCFEGTWPMEAWVCTRGGWRGCRGCRTAWLLWGRPCSATPPWGSEMLTGKLSTTTCLPGIEHLLHAVPNAWGRMAWGIQLLNTLDGSFSRLFCSQRCWQMLTLSSLGFAEIWGFVDRMQHRKM